MDIGLPTAPEPATAPPRDGIWGPWATLGLGAVVLFVFFTVMVVIVIVMAVALAVGQPGAFTNVEDIANLVTGKLGLVISVAGIGSYIVGTALILAVIKAKKGKNIADYLGLRRVGWRTLLVLLAVTGAYLVLVAVIASLAKIQEEDTGILTQAYDTSVWPVLFWLAVVVFAPLFEEPLARGFLFEGFRRSRLGLVGAVVLTSLIWTSLHVGYSSFSLAAIFGFGLVLGFVRWRTGSLWSTMLMHAFYNAVSLSILAFSHP